MRKKRKDEDEEGARKKEQRQHERGECRAHFLSFASLNFAISFSSGCISGASCQTNRTAQLRGKRSKEGIMSISAEASPAAQLARIVTPER